VRADTGRLFESGLTRIAPSDAIHVLATLSLGPVVYRYAMTRPVGPRLLPRKQFDVKLISFFFISISLVATMNRFISIPVISNTDLALQAAPSHPSSTSPSAQYPDFVASRSNNVYSVPAEASQLASSPTFVDDLKLARAAEAEANQALREAEERALRTASLAAKQVAAKVQPTTPTPGLEGPNKKGGLGGVGIFSSGVNKMSAGSVAFFLPDPCSSSASPEPAAFWTRRRCAIQSFARMRQGEAYELHTSSAAVDMFNVVLEGRTVHLYAPDPKSIQVVDTLKRSLFGNMLRGGTGIPPLKVELHRHAMPAGECDPEPAGGSALYFISPWYWNNLYHLINDATMMAFHVAKTPNPSFDTIVSRKSRLMLFAHPYGAVLSESPEGNIERMRQQEDEVSPTWALPWARILFGQKLFPGGHADANLLFNDTRKRCVASFHYGHPARVLSSNGQDGVPISERREALDLLNSHVNDFCRSQMEGHTSDIGNYLRDDDRPKAIFVKRSRDEDDPFQLYYSQELSSAPVLDKGRNRWYNQKGLTMLKTAFEEQGVLFETCCDFEEDTPCKMVGYTRAS